ncbi:MAG: hypothetical protein HN742_11155 [Lentisphaerae bacterium]|jgi:hypothetical protein|nr:hypothetical protein [Lentisphaerota bacterium]MBT4816097.1 hypothetical protein [Lentisphaerota bacterium]MBT5610511.1 hypothetical protein [Lentisphaerota bacterium]MBT7056066.1 hypothetical protein [Lentisphaerota bacterium]MBT7842423.1 hypothetical protein [Lentisphaerota bacterium]
MKSQTPVSRIRAGAVSCALWENEIEVKGTQRRILKASIAVRFKDRNGEWQSSQTFTRNEIPLAIYCLQKAFEQMIESPPEQEPKVVEEYVE